MKFTRLLIINCLIIFSIFILLSQTHAQTSSFLSVSTDFQSKTTDNQIALDQDNNLTLDIKVAGTKLVEANTVSLEINNNPDLLLTFYNSGYNFGKCSPSIYGVDENCDSLINKYRNGYGVTAYYSSTENSKEWQVVFKGSGSLFRNLLNNSQNTFTVIVKDGNSNEFLGSSILSFKLPSSAEKFSSTGQVLGDATYNFTQNLQLGSRSPEVKLLQQLLNNNTLLVAKVGPGSYGNETEYFGQGTKMALEKFQQLVGLKTTGALDEATRGYIANFYNPLTNALSDLTSASGTEASTTNSTPTDYFFHRVLTLGDTGEGVKELQQFLNTHGFSVAPLGTGSLGEESDYYGEKTKEAVEKYQLAMEPKLKDYDLSETDLVPGSLDFYTLILVNSDLFLPNQN